MSNCPIPCKFPATHDEEEESCQHRSTRCQIERGRSCVLHRHLGARQWRCMWRRMPCSGMLCGLAAACWARCLNLRRSARRGLSTRNTDPASAGIVQLSQMSCSETVGCTDRPKTFPPIVQQLTSYHSRGRFHTQSHERRINHFSYDGVDVCLAPGRRTSIYVIRMTVYRLFVSTAWVDLRSAFHTHSQSSLIRTAYGIFCVRSDHITSLPATPG